jgi:hypothetical protein
MKPINILCGHDAVTLEAGCTCRYHCALKGQPTVKKLIVTFQNKGIRIIISTEYVNYICFSTSKLFRLLPGHISHPA